VKGVVLSREEVICDENGESREEDNVTNVGRGAVDDALMPVAIVCSDKCRDSNAPVSSIKPASRLLHSGHLMGSSIFPWPRADGTYRLVSSMKSSLAC